MKVDHHIQQYYITENWYVHVILFPWNNIKKYIFLSFLYKFIREYSNLIENFINLRISYWTKQYQKKIIGKWMLHQWLKHGYMHCETLLMLMVLSHLVLGILVACPLILTKVFRTLYLPFHKMQCELAFQTHIHTYDAKVFPKY
jgi:hypothetical protein